MSQHHLTPEGREHLSLLAEERPRDWHGRFLPEYGKINLQYEGEPGALMEKYMSHKAPKVKIIHHIHHYPQSEGMHCGYRGCAAKSELRDWHGRFVSSGSSSASSPKRANETHCGYRGCAAKSEPRDWHGRFMASNRSSPSKGLKKPGRSPRSLAAQERMRNSLGQFTSYY